MRSVRLYLAAAALFLGACASGSVPTPTAGAEPVEVMPGFFSAAQAARGRASYKEHCDECHALSELRGTEFEWTWRRQTAWDLYQEVSSNMPEDKPGELSAPTYADIIAYILNLNDYQVGSRDLVASRAAMAAIPLGSDAQKTKSKE